MALRRAPSAQACSQTTTLTAFSSAFRRSRRPGRRPGSPARGSHPVRALALPWMRKYPVPGRDRRDGQGPRDRGRLRDDRRVRAEPGLEDGRRSRKLVLRIVSSPTTKCKNGYFQHDALVLERLGDEPHGRVQAFMSVEPSPYRRPSRTSKFTGSRCPALGLDRSAVSTWPFRASERAPLPPAPVRTPTKFLAPGREPPSASPAPPARARAGRRSPRIAADHVRAAYAGEGQFELLFVRTESDAAPRPPRGGRRCAARLEHLLPSHRLGAALSSDRWQSRPRRASVACSPSLFGMPLLFDARTNSAFSGPRVGALGGHRRRLPVGRVQAETRRRLRLAVFPSPSTGATGTYSATPLSQSTRIELEKGWGTGACACSPPRSRDPVVLDDGVDVRRRRPPA